MEGSGDLLERPQPAKLPICEKELKKRIGLGMVACVSIPEASFIKPATDPNQIPGLVEAGSDELGL